MKDFPLCKPFSQRMSKLFNFIFFSEDFQMQRLSVILDGLLSFDKGRTTEGYHMPKTRPAHSNGTHPTHKSDVTQKKKKKKKKKTNAFPAHCAKAKL